MFIYPYSPEYNQWENHTYTILQNIKLKLIVEQF